MVNLYTKEGKEFKCVSNGKIRYCKPNNRKKNNSSFICKLSDKKNIEAGKFIGRITTGVASVKFPAISPFAPIAENLIDKSANVLHRFNLKNC